MTNGSIYSEPFYSARNGYKIRLAASLNGQHSGRGSHVGLRIQLMRGDNDARLGVYCGDLETEGQITRKKKLKSRENFSKDLCNF